MDKNLVEQFFINQTTPGETERVLKWFDTPDGKQYLQERLDIDYNLMDRKKLRAMVPELDSDRLYQSIQQKIHPEQKKIVIRKPDWMGHVFKAVAVVLVILAASLFYVTTYTSLSGQETERRSLYFQKEDEQHREVTLSDGSVIRLNSNSELTISEGFMKGRREVTLSGEAYFDVAHNPEQPFIIHANQSTVRVLGTSFNVRSHQGEDNVQVAVVDGRVSFTNAYVADGDSDSESNTVSGVVLTKGQYAYMDIRESRFQVDDLAVENYLAWMSGRFVFEKLTLQQVCTQLNRLYSVQCSFTDAEIKDLRLTANFSNESLDKTLSVIALSLGIEFENEGDRVLWSGPLKKKNMTNNTTF